ncbi:hypothetical protein JA1_000629 [Spathaspora sp. JA1]|nr:hypothetical protein JA1_000629 [Spathaspora sp. JA1]
MAYSLDVNKWKAYQFGDPFAVGSFYVCHKVQKTFCRPDCDAYPITNLRQDIKFVDSPSEAISFGYTPCDSCDPCHSFIVDVDLLIKCVSTINGQIGFMPPLLDEDEEYNTQKIKENILETKRANEEQILKTINNVITNDGNYRQHRYSLPIFNTKGKLSKELESTPLSKNDSDHYRLVDLACRHLALAAAVSVFQPQSRVSTSPEVEDKTAVGGKKRRRRRRRGGVLGFKELAAKSKLSAWHFHRVFKSVTGLTPKTYGDKCFDFLKKVDKSGEYTTFQEASVYNSPPLSSSSQSRPASSIRGAESSLASSPILQHNSNYKRVKLEETPVLFKTEFFNPTQIQPAQPVYQENKMMITPPNDSVQQYTTVSPSQALDSHSSSAASFPNLAIAADLQRQLNSNNPSNNMYGVPPISTEDFFHSRAFSLPELSRTGTSTFLNNNLGDLNVGTVTPQQQSLFDSQATNQQQPFLQIPPELDLSRDIYSELSRPVGSNHSNVTFEFGDSNTNPMLGSTTLNAPDQSLGYCTNEDIFSNEQKYNPQLLSTNIGL